MSQYFRSCRQSFASSAQPPESDTENLPVPEGSTEDKVQLGARIYHGLVGGASCTGCHGANGTGTATRARFDEKEWMWSDGSFAGILESDYQRRAQPKKFRSPMPPMGGAELTDGQASALAAYVGVLAIRRRSNYFRAALHFDDYTELVILSAAVFQA